MYACFDCGNLEKSKRKQNSNSNYNYGCNARGSGYTCGDISKDSELKMQGCSDWKPKNKISSEQVSLFDFFNDETEGNHE